MTSAAIQEGAPPRFKERGVLFSGPMVRSIKLDLKWQTRRVVKPQPTCGEPYYEKYCSLHGALPVPCPYGKPGDRLWVRETWQQVIRRRVTSEEAWWPGRQEWPGIGSRPHSPSKLNAEHHVIIYRADGEMPGGFPERWRPSIFMPRWASRFTLEITEVRVQRLHEISEEDAIAEGCGPEWAVEARVPPGKQGFAHLWSCINGLESWEANPWVWAITFTKLGGSK